MINRFFRYYSVKNRNAGRYAAGHPGVDYVGNGIPVDQQLSGGGRIYLADAAVKQDRAKRADPALINIEHGRSAFCPVLDMGQNGSSSVSEAQIMPIFITIPSNLKVNGAKAHVLADFCCGSGQGRAG